MSIKEFIKTSCHGDNQVSSKRVVMYAFTVVAMAMIAVEALFNLILIIKWLWIGSRIGFEMVFGGLIYGYVFGIIAALAGINGFSKQSTPVTSSPDKFQEDMSGGDDQPLNS